MPPVDVVRAQHTMKMERIIVQNFPFEKRETLVDIISRSGTSTRAIVNLYNVDDDRTRGYLPSKVWKVDGSTEMVFYCTPSLPAGARPFGEGPMYVFELLVGSQVTVEYDVEARLFVDQVVTPNGVWYVFVFGEDQLGKIIAQPKG